MARKNILVCIDRDGTIEYDDRYHLGHQRNWKSKVKVLPHVIKGIKLLKKIKNIKIYMISNQPGVAIKDFPLLTQKRAEEVSQYVIKLLKKKGALVDGYRVCGHANSSYVKKRKEYKFNNKLVCNCSCIKPSPGMIYEILKEENMNKSNTNIYVLGDRLTDVQTGINAKGIGILIPFNKRIQELAKVKKLKSNSRYIAKNFLDAINYIIKKEK